MRLFTPFTVLTVSALTLIGDPSGASASDTSTAAATTTAVSATSQPHCPPPGPGLEHIDNGFDQYRHEPDLGAPGSPASGFKHFPFSMAMFTEWHRPRAATLTKCQRCAPDPFRPRGFGHLFARPCDSFRMDYNPHVLSTPDSNYGPAYLYNAPDQRCDDCDHRR